MGRDDSISPCVKMLAIAIAALLTACILDFPAQAEIIYHSADIVINNGSYNLDLNGDGVTDFTITGGHAGTCSEFSYGVSEMPSSGNGAIVGPLKLGAEIGPSQAFDGVEGTLAWVGRVHVAILGEVPCWGGPWEKSNVGEKIGYLGLSLQLNGQTYYGWAKLQIVWSASKSGALIHATLLGYAYETIAGRAIYAGETSYVWFTPAFLNFGTVTRGNTASRKVAVTNLGPTILLISNAAISGINSADFSSENENPPCSGSLAAGAKCVLTFTFTPSIVGQENSTYSVYADGGASPQQLPLTGTGQ